MFTWHDLWTTPSSNWILLLLHSLAMKTFQKKWKILSSSSSWKESSSESWFAKRKPIKVIMHLRPGERKVLTRILFFNWNISERFKPFFDFLVFSDEKQYSSNNNGPETLDTITLTSSFTSTSVRWNYTHITARNSGWSPLRMKIFHSENSKIKKTFCGIIELNCSRKSMCDRLGKVFTH